MILITGATGTIGSEVVRQLAGPRVAVRAMTREVTRAEVPAGVEVVRGDFERSDSLTKAVDGVDAVFLLTAPGSSVPDHDRAMIDAARASTVRKIVKLSAIGTTDDATDPTDRHAPGERALAESGLAWTILRPSSFATNALGWAGQVRASQPVPNMTGVGAQGVVDPVDIAAVAVQALLSDDHNGQTYTPTGPAALSVPDQVAQLAAELGRKIDIVEVPPDSVRQQMISAGWNVSVVETAVAGFASVRAGGNAVVTDDVERVLGRSARTFRQWAHDHRAAFTDH